MWPITLAGTNQKPIKAKSPAERIVGIYQAHYGPVYALQRNPCFPKVEWKLFVFPERWPVTYFLGRTSWQLATGVPGSGLRISRRAPSCGPAPTLRISLMAAGVPPGHQFSSQPARTEFWTPGTSSTSRASPYSPSRQTSKHILSTTSPFTTTWAIPQKFWCYDVNARRCLTPHLTRSR